MSVGKWIQGSEGLIVLGVGEGLSGPRGGLGGLGISFIVSSMCG